MKDNYDILVVGAGPAGSLAAKTAAQAGCSVLLIEKRPAIGSPVRCAEGIVKHDLEEFITPDPKWISQKITRAVFTAPDKTSFTITGKTGNETLGYTLDRKIFDRALSQQAAEAGAEIAVHARAEPLLEHGRLCGALIHQHGTTRTVRAKIVIAADGVESKFAKTAGINTTVKLSDIDSCIEYLITDIDIDPEANIFYWSKTDCPDGYIWIFPKGPRSANIGLGIPGSKSGDGHRAKDYLDRYIAREFPNGKITELIVGGVTTCPPLDTTVADNLIIAGDAARLSDPFTGGGIYQAMYSGQLAGTTAARAVRNGNTSKETLMEYDRTLKNSHIGKFLTRSAAIRDIFFSMTDQDLNRITRSISELRLKHVTIPSVLLAILKKNPWLILRFPALLRDR